MDAYCKSASEYLTAYFNHHRPRFPMRVGNTPDYLFSKIQYPDLSLDSGQYDEGPFVLCHGDFHQPNL
jgi:hypothetical protein